MRSYINVQMRCCDTGICQSAWNRAGSSKNDKTFDLRVDEDEKKSTILTAAPDRHKLHEIPLMFLELASRSRETAQALPFDSREWACERDTHAARAWHRCVSTWSARGMPAALVVVLVVAVVIVVVVVADNRRWSCRLVARDRSFDLIREPVKYWLTTIRRWLPCWAPFCHIGIGLPRFSLLFIAVSSLRKLQWWVDVIVFSLRNNRDKQLFQVPRDRNC